MLKKDNGNPRIHRLRIIHIYEADYNLLLAVKWREALYHAESKQEIIERWVIRESERQVGA